MKNKFTQKFISLLKYVFIIVITIVFAFLMVFFLSRRVEIKGDAMKPLMSDGSTVVMNTISPIFFDMKREDVVVYLPDIDSPTVYKVGRIIGVGGETIQIKDKKILIDGKEYAKGGKVETAGVLKNPVTLGMNEYIILGDNYSGSDDSRYEYIGKISNKKIKGRVWGRLSPDFTFDLGRK